VVVLVPRLVGTTWLVISSFWANNAATAGDATRLLDDIAQSDGKYSLQPIVVKRNDETFELIAGRQRLTNLH
jgi:hypothetical protein